MASLFKDSLIFVVLVYALFFLLPPMVNSSDDEDNLLQGINSYRTSLNLQPLRKNDKANCLADRIAGELEDQPCAYNINPLQLANYNKFINKCKIDPRSTTDSVVMPVCVRKLVPTLVLTNYTHSGYSKYLNDSKYTGAGVGKEDDWMVVILTTNTPAGSFVSDATSLVLKVGLGYYVVMYLLLGLIVCLV